MPPWILLLCIAIALVFTVYKYQQSVQKSAVSVPIGATTPALHTQITQPVVHVVVKLPNVQSGDIPEWKKIVNIIGTKKWISSLRPDAIAFTDIKYGDAISDVDGTYIPITWTACNTMGRCNRNSQSRGKPDGIHVGLTIIKYVSDDELIMKDAYSGTKMTPA